MGKENNVVILIPEIPATSGNELKRIMKEVIDKAEVRIAVPGGREEHQTAILQRSDTLRSNKV